MFYSVLFPTEESAARPRRKTAPEAFSDLQLDVIMKRGLQDYQELDLQDVYYTPVTDMEVIRYRQEILRELEDPSVREALSDIVERFGSLRVFMDGLRERLEAGSAVAAQQGRAQKARGDIISILKKKTPDWMDMGRVLEKLGQFADTLADFAGSVEKLSFRSAGLRGFAEYVAEFCRSERFREMAEEARQLRAAFDEIRYCLWFKSDSYAVKVLRCEKQEDYVSGIEALFARFRQGEVQDFRRHLEEEPVSEKLENEILKRLAHEENRCVIVVTHDPSVAAEADVIVNMCDGKMGA